MKETFIFDLDWQSTSQRPLRITTVFFPKGSITERQCRDILKTYLEAKYDAPPDVVLLVGTAGLRDLLGIFCNSRLINDSIPSFTRRSDPPAVRAICLTKSGTFIPCSEAAQPFVEQAFVTELQRQGMLTIAKNNASTVIESAGMVHYVKPSGDHTNRFIRAANALVKSSEIAFVAFWLSPFITDDIDVIYTDTAGINGVVFNATLLKLQNDKNWSVPYVDSFSSYKGLDTYPFTSIRRSLFVISASTSGALANKVKEKFGIHKSRIVTLFYLGAKPSSADQILCDITKSAAGFAEPATSYSAVKCVLCQSNIPAIAIDGDQFLLGHLEPHSELIQSRNVPRWLNQFMSEFYGKKVLRTYRSDPAAPERTRELFIDLKQIYETEHDKAIQSGLLWRLDRKLDHCLPVTLQRVIYIDDPSSKALAERIRHHLQQHWGERDIPLTPHSRLPDENIESSDFAKGTLLLVAGTLITGQQMMSVNQTLRNRSGDSIVYFVGITRTTDEQRLQEIRSNIQFARHGSHPFFSVADIFIPDDGLSRVIPWDAERYHWIRFKRRVVQAQMLDREVFKWIDERLAVLRKGRSHGLLDELFLPTIDGARLALRPGFAFWEFPYNKDLVTQADVYFSVAAILHVWREENARKVGDFSRRYGRIIISPKNFYRYNDGIIQASILRAAGQGELDYRYDEQLSNAMYTVLTSVFSNFDNTRGEATLEFLLALLQKHLNLGREPLLKALDDLNERLKGRTGLHERIAQQLCAAVRDDVVRRTI